MSHENQWLAQKTQAEAELKAAISIGLPLELAKSVSRWNKTYEYNTFNDMQFVGESASIGTKAALTLLFSRSESRANPGGLDGAVLDAGKLYAIWIPDVPELLITQVTFKLNATPVHVEFSAPWDYAGTTGGGDSTRVSFVAGSYSIEAVIVDTNGFDNISASFEVE